MEKIQHSKEIAVEEDSATVLVYCQNSCGLRSDSGRINTPHNLFSAANCLCGSDSENSEKEVHSFVAFGVMNRVRRWT